ncbi:hypothetical protein ACWC9U_31160 [Streptomyces sp. 900116325]
MSRLSAATSSSARASIASAIFSRASCRTEVVSQDVAASVQEEARHRLGAQLQVFGSLRWLVAEDLDKPTLLRRLERLSGYEVYVCTPQGRPLLPGVPVPDPCVLPASVDAPPTVPGGFVLPVPAPGGPAGFLVAYEREGAQPAGLAVVQHIATVAALRVAMVRNERQTLRREGAETLAELLQEVLDPEAARRRLARHASEGATVLIVVRRTTDEALLRCLQDHPHLLLTWGEDRYVLGAPQLADRIGDLPDVAAGMSRPFLPGAALRVAQREALWAVSKAVESGRPGDPLRGRFDGPLAARRPGGADRAGRACPRRGTALRRGARLAAAGLRPHLDGA